VSPSPPLICWDLKCRSSCSLFPPYIPYFLRLFDLLCTRTIAAVVVAGPARNVSGLPPIVLAHDCSPYLLSNDWDDGNSGFIIIRITLKVHGRSLKLVTVSKTPSYIIWSCTLVYVYSTVGVLSKKRVVCVSF